MIDKMKSQALSVQGEDFIARDIEIVEEEASDEEGKDRGIGRNNQSQQTSHIDI